MTQAQAQVEEVTCYAHYSDDSHFSDAWGTTVLNIWIAAKKAFLAEKLTVAAFKELILDGIIAAANWRDQYRDAYLEAGVDLEDDDAFDEAYQAYENENRQDAINLVPTGLFTEFRWIPEWTWGGLDEVMESHGLSTSNYRNTSLEYVLPGEWLARFLRLVNVSSEALVAEGIAERGADGKVFADRVAQAKFAVPNDPEKPSLMTPIQVITTLENAYSYAVLVVHAEMNVRALLELDPSKPMVLSTQKGGCVHIGLHDFVNGAGYMDTYPGEIVIPAGETGFTGGDRWSYGINSVYGLHKPAFYTTPKNG